VDITHISNEVPFAEDCPSPDPNQESLYFCSKDEYIQLLEAVGTDIVELSGDHFGDWGPEAMFHSLELYNQRNWLTYGGGETLQTGLAPVFIEHNGNRFAFIGCNGKAHDRYATASDTNPGASPCDFDWMFEEIRRLSGLGYLVIATMQHEEVDSFYSIAIQQHDFRGLADSGAVIVSGSQAHHPQAVEFYNSSFIHYGLGNLFFDQWHLAHYNPTFHFNKDKSFIDIHYFYEGSYINTRLIPLQFIDNARPRPMTPEERIDFLELVFSSSVWDIQTE
jgi:poly-gamma-glutamate synthesis protein (capsule biosynthesis protein)